MDHHDLLVGQFHARVVLGDARIGPGGDLAQEDVGKHVAAEAEIVDAGHVEGRHVGAKDGWNVDELDL